MIEIEICERIMDYWLDDYGKRQPKYHACIAGQTGIWGAGRNPSEAVGDLVDGHPEMFGVTIIYRGKLPR